MTQNHDSYKPNTLTTVPVSLSTEESSDEESNNENGNEDYDNYFSKYQSTENTEPIEALSSKTVRFSDNLNNVAVITPQNSINQSQSLTTTSDSDETDDESTAPNIQTTNNHVIEKEPNNNETDEDEVTMRNNASRALSNVSLTESADLPPPLPPLPPLNSKPSNFLLSF
jgi:hypothetical protein